MVVRQVQDHEVVRAVRVPEGRLLQQPAPHARQVVVLVVMYAALLQTGHRGFVHAAHVDDIHRNEEEVRLRGIIYPAYC